MFGIWIGVVVVGLCDVMVDLREKFEFFEFFVIVYSMGGFVVFDFVK